MRTTFWYVSEKSGFCCASQSAHAPTKLVMLEVKGRKQGMRLTRFAFTENTDLVVTHSFKDGEQNDRKEARLHKE